MIVPSEELRFAWDHKTKPSTCVILHAGKVVLRGDYETTRRRFDQSQCFDSTNVEYEETLPPAPEKD